MANIEQLKKKFEGEWLAIEVTKEDRGISLEGDLIIHSPDREKIWKDVPSHKDKVIYITYAGPSLEDGYAAAFNAKRNL